MNNWFIIVAAVAFLLFPLLSHDAKAGGLYDGEWKGSATSSDDQRCKRATVNLTVEGKVVLGQAKFDGDSPNINGAVDESGSVGATIGFQFFKGQFAGDDFAGTFTFGNCQWDAQLHRTSDRNHTATSGQRSP